MVIPKFLKNNNAQINVRASRALADRSHEPHYFSIDNHYKADGGGLLMAKKIGILLIHR